MAQHIYGFGSDHSYYRDLIDVELETLDRRDQAKKRLQAHAEDMLATDEARTVRAIMQTRARKDGQEDRAVSTASTSDGVFVTPSYLVSAADFAHSYPAAAIDQVTSVPDPGYGVTLNIPTLTAITSTDNQSTPNVNPTTGQQTTVPGELTGVSDSAPTGAYSQGPIITLAGEVPVSLQLFDRSGPTPYTIDRIIQLALRDSLLAEVDNYLLTQMTAAGGITNGAASYTAAAFMQDVAETQAAIMTGNNVRLPATHAWTSPALAQWLLSQSDPQGRPLTLTPPPNTPSAVRLSDVGAPAAGYTGTTLLGSHFFSDGNIPDLATNPVQAPLVFANTSEVFLMQSEPCVRIISEGVDDNGQGAPTLSVLIQYYSYVGVVVRHSTAVNSLHASYLVAAPAFT